MTLEKSFSRIKLFLKSLYGMNAILTKWAHGKGISNFAASILSLLMPLIPVLYFHVPRIVLGNFTDAVFYLSYSRQFGELVLRYGFPYYATRFGGIFPDSISGNVFGNIAGIWILRWILSLTVSLSLYRIFKTRFGILAGIVSSFLWAFNPVVIRLICTTYVDSTSVPFLILGCCIVCSKSDDILAAFAAGILFALAASAHLYAAFALLLLLPLLVSARWDRDRCSVRFASWVGAGFSVTFIVAWIWYWKAWGMPAIFSPTIEVIHDISLGKGECWKKPIINALEDAPIWLAPIALMPAVLLTARHGSILARGAAISIVASICFFWVGDLFGRAFVLSLPFYYSFLLPVTIITTAVVCGECLKKMERQTTAWIFTIVITVGIAIIIVLASWHRLSNASSIIIATFGSGIMLVTPESIRLKRLLCVVLCCIFSTSILMSKTRFFSQIIEGYATSDIGLIQKAILLGELLPKADKDTKITKFWCDDSGATREGRDSRMIVSFWLNTFSKLQGKNEEFIEFLNLKKQDSEAVSQSGVDRIVIFNESKEIVDHAIGDIKALDMPFEIKKREFKTVESNPHSKIEIAILERKTELDTRKKQIISLEKIQLSNGGKSQIQKNGIKLISSKIKWEDFARIPIGRIEPKDKITVKYNLCQGRVRLAISDEKYKPLQYVEKWATKEDQEIQIIITEELNCGYLTLYNLYPNGAESEITLKSIEKTSIHQGN